MYYREMIGQQDVRQHLISLVQQQHLPHAMLFSGPEGSGAMPLALATARYIFCLQRGETDACGQCSACIKMNSLQHPDLHLSFPTFRKEGAKSPPKSADFLPQFRAFLKEHPYASDVEWLEYIEAPKQGNITADECRDIIQRLQMRSFESEFKILIMWYPEYLDKNGNILLKLIEEPTEKTLLFLVSSRPDALLPTIRSRTQTVALKRLSDHEIRKALLDRQVDEKQASLMARFAEGNFQRALRGTGVHAEQVLMMRQWLNALYTRRGADLVEWIGQLTDQDLETQKHFLQYTLQLFEHYIRYQFGQTDELVLLEQEKNMLQVLHAKGMKLHLLRSICSTVNQALMELERNVHGKIVFHTLSLRVQQLVVPQS